MKIAIIGAGPAGLTSAKQAIERGHEVVVFEKHQAVGGIWNPNARGAYRSVRLQSSRLSFSFSDFPPISGEAFLGLTEMHEYLIAYAREFGVLPLIRFSEEVTSISKDGGTWAIIANGHRHFADAVMIATGELWVPRRLADAGNAGRTLSAKDYHDPKPFVGKKILVVGGGVSGADIAAELGEAGAIVDWSVRRVPLFLPRMCAEGYNDALLSYAGRVAVGEMGHGELLQLLDRIAPGQIARWAKVGLLPDLKFPNAVHINDSVLPALEKGWVRKRQATMQVRDGTIAHFADGTAGEYETIFECIGYGMPDYSFVEGMRREELYEHFIFWRDPSLTVINTPVDTEAFGTACPYFEAIAGWVLRTFDGSVSLPPKEQMQAWCAENMANLTDRRYYDCWLETIRLCLKSGTIPDPSTEFSEYWKLISGSVDPARLSQRPVQSDNCPLDDLTRLNLIRDRILASIDPKSRAGLVASGQIGSGDALRAARIPAEERLDAGLPYPMR